MMEIKCFVVPLRRFVFLAAFLCAGCSDMPPYESLFDTSPEAVGTGIAGIGLVRAVIIIAKYRATEQQRKVAEENAHRAVRSIASPEEIKPAGNGNQGAKPVEKRVKKKLPHYVAVDTQPDARSKGAKSIMIWDTIRETMVSDDVLDVQTAPALAHFAKFDTIQAEYLGTP